MATSAQNLSEQFRPQEVESAIPWRLIIFAFLLLLLSVLLYGGLTFGYEPYLNSQIQKIDGQLQGLSGAVSQSDQDNLIHFYSQLANFNKVLKSHVASSKIFSLLEKDANQKVFFTDVDLRVSERSLILQGTAASYAVLASQLAAFDAEPMVTKYLLNQSQFSNSLVNFKVTLTLSPDIFKP